jgi:hypothetical protein
VTWPLATPGGRRVVQPSDGVRSTLRNAQTIYVNAIADGTSQFTVNAQGSLAVGDFAAISDCVKFVAFQVAIWCSEE